MPNWNRNYLEVEGDKKQKQEFLKALKSKGFSGIAPIGKPDIGKAIETWGTKWDIDPKSVKTLKNKNKEKIVFDTAWSPPVNFIENASKKYPGLKFRLKYVEPGFEFYGQTEYKNGKKLKSLECNLADPKKTPQCKRKLNEILNDTKHDKGLYSLIAEYKKNPQKFNQEYSNYQNTRDAKKQKKFRFSDIVTADYTIPRTIALASLGGLAGAKLGRNIKSTLEGATVGGLVGLTLERGYLLPSDN